MSSPWDLLYRRVFAVLSVDPGVLALVPLKDITPDTDPTKANSTALTYAVSAGEFNPKTRKGSCILTVQAASITNKIQAQKILGAVAAVLTARSLTSRPEFAVGLFQQTPANVDGGTDDTERRFIAQDEYQVRFVIPGGNHGSP